GGEALDLGEQDGAGQREALVEADGVGHDDAAAEGQEELAREADLDEVVGAAEGGRGPAEGARDDGARGRGARVRAPLVGEERRAEERGGGVDRRRRGVLVVARRAQELGRAAEAVPVVLEGEEHAGRELARQRRGAADGGEQAEARRVVGAVARGQLELERYA